jgi:hypothetical protein
MIVVDPLFDFPGPRGHTRWCHMGSTDASPEGLEELHAVARKIGLKREWYQDKRWHKHYDIVPSRRADAVRKGLVKEVDQDEYILLVSMSPIADRERAERPDDYRAARERIGLS